MSLYLLSLHTHTPLVITHYFLEAAVWTESDAKLQISVDFGAEFGRNMLQDVANCQFFLPKMSESGGKIWKFARLFVSLHRERWNQVEPRCAERWHGCGSAEMMSNSTLPLGFLHLGYSWSRVGQLLYFPIFG